MSGHNPKNSAEHLVFSVSPLERFLRVGFFKKKLGWGSKIFLEKKMFSYEEYFPKISLAKVSFEKK